MMDNDLYAAIVCSLVGAIVAGVLIFALERGAAAARQARMHRDWEANRTDPHRWKDEP